MGDHGRHAAGAVTPVVGAEIDSDATGGGVDLTWSDGTATVHSATVSPGPTGLALRARGSFDSVVLGYAKVGEIDPTDPLVSIDVESDDDSTGNGGAGDGEDLNGEDPSGEDPNDEDGAPLISLDIRSGICGDSLAAIEAGAEVGGGGGAAALADVQAGAEVGGGGDAPLLNQDAELEIGSDDGLLDGLLGGLS